MLMRAWITALAISLLPGSVLARGTKLLVVVRSADSETAITGKRLSLALGREIHESLRYQWVDLDVVAGGPDMERAQRELDGARRKARRGRDALYRLEVRESAQMLREAIATYKDNAAYLTDVTELSNSLMYLGAILLHAKKTQAAKKLMAEAITLVPNIDPDPQVFNPPMRRSFDEIRKKVLATRGSLAITSSPPGALAVVDGRAIGLTPIAVHDLHEGRHVVRVIDDGLVSWGDVIDVVANAETQANAKLMTPTRLPDLPGQIGDAYRAAARGANAAAHVADLGRTLDVDQILLVRVRPTSDGTLVEAALYGIHQSIRLARVKREIPTRDDMAKHASALLAELKPPPLAILVAALRVPGGRAELGRNAKRAVTGIVGDFGGAVSFLSTPLTPPCFNDPRCVSEAASTLTADGVLELEIKGGNKLRVRARCLDGHTGESLWTDQLTASADGLRDSTALRATISRAVDSLWEMRAEVGDEPADANEASEMNTVTWEPSQKPAEEPNVLTAPVPDEPIRWGRVLGWTTVALGTATAIGGTVLAFDRNAILADANSSGVDKESARRTGLFALGAVAMGVGVTALGGWLTWDSYQD